MSISPSLTSPNCHEGLIKSFLFCSSGCVLIIHKVHSSFGQSTSGQYIYIYIYISYQTFWCVVSLSIFTNCRIFMSPQGELKCKQQVKIISNTKPQNILKVIYQQLLYFMRISYKAGKVIHMLFVFYLVQLDNKSFSH